VASKILTRSAIVDKLVGDEVMALYLPQLLGAHWEDDLIRDAIDRAYVGNVGAGEVKDFTVLGDVVNTASRLQAAAQVRQIVMSERLFDRLANRPSNAVAVSLQLKGKRHSEPARVIDLETLSS
jgi:adenylate cyclase